MQLIAIKINTEEIISVEGNIKSQINIGEKIMEINILFLCPVFIMDKI